MAKRTKTNSSALPSLTGVLHLPPLLGSPEWRGDARAWDTLEARVHREATLLARSGFDGLVLENFGDAPFYKSQVGPETVASMTRLALIAREAAPKLSLGINVLRNDARSALAIAGVCGAQWIRVNVLSGVVASDQGFIEGDAAFIVRERARLGLTHVKICADVLVKHARTYSTDVLELAIEEVSGRGGADAVIITGSTTGRAPEADRVRAAVVTGEHSGVPVWVGSGATRETLRGLYASGISGVIVGSALRVGGRAGDAAMDPARVRAFAKAAD